MECAGKIEHIRSVIYYTICGAVCFHFTHFLHGDWENIYTLSYYHNKIGSMNNYPLFKVRSWNNGMRCMSLYILMSQIYDAVFRHWVIISYLRIIYEIKCDYDTRRMLGAHWQIGKISYIYLWSVIADRIIYLNVLINMIFDLLLNAITGRGEFRNCADTLQKTVSI